MTPASQANERAVLSSDDGTTQTFWLVDPSDPTAPRPVWSSVHSPHWSGRAVVSPDGGSIALTELPPTARDPDHEAELRVVDIATQREQMLATSVDLRSTLVWSNDGRSIAYQRFEATGEELLLQSRSGGRETIAAKAGAGERLFPLDVRQNGVLVVVFGSGGAALERFQNGVVYKLHQLSTGGVARDFVLSPDGKQLAYLSTEASDGSGLSRARVVAMDGSTAKELPEDWGEIVGVTWDERGRLVAGSTGGAAGLYQASGERLRAMNRSGFLQPLAWSPSGDYLAVRAFNGTSGSEPGNADDELLTADGRLLPLADSGAARFIGWSAISAGMGGER
jgi:Tol biopolymer transport system component